MNADDELKRKQFEEQYADIRKERVASGIMRQVQEQMIVWFPFLNRAVLRMPYAPLKKRRVAAEMNGGNLTTDSNDRKNPGTDGTSVYADPDLVIHLYRRDRIRLQRSFLHMIFHCLFCHPFRYDMLEIEMWDLSCDIAVENVVLSLERKELALPEDMEKRLFLEKLKKSVHPLTADNIYHFYYKNPDRFEDDQKHADSFLYDTHGMWISANEMFGFEILDNEGENDFVNGETENRWKNISNLVKVESEVLRRYQDSLPGSAIDNIKAVYREKKDYSEFLKQFIAPREEMKVNPDEYDYIYYTYGMKLYGNMPLIEPLEYQDKSRIHDFVIAIDTSGSCQGKIVRSFLNKTYTVLKTAGAFFETMNVRIIQCDSKIQSDDRITTLQEFDSYISNLKVRGYGGTDFRPVFELVDQYIAQKEFNDLRGLIYFTDGLGTYPGIVPSYPTAFVIIEDDKEKPVVPPWAIKLITTAEDLDRNDKRIRSRNI